MANKTTNYDLVKPLPNEYYDVAIQNDNMDIIDDELKKLEDNKVDNLKVLTDVPAGAKFTDTTYTKATISKDGLMAKEDKEKLDGVEEGANKTTVNNTLTGTSTSQALSARQGKQLKDDLENHKEKNAIQSLLTRQEILDIKLKLSEALVYEFLNNTGIGFYDLFTSVDYVDTNETTASVNIGDNKVAFSGLKKLVMLEQEFMNFANVELALYDLDRSSLQVENNSNTNKIEVLIPPNSVNAGDRFIYKNKIYTVTKTEQI